ncbi:conserved hypothetical protein [Azospirillaceae bacterium]
MTDHDSGLEIDYREDKENLETTPLLGRRNLIRLGAMAVAGAAFSNPLDALAATHPMPLRKPTFRNDPRESSRESSREPSHRELAFLNINTGEHLRIEYWAKGRYLKDGMHAVARMLRDHRSGSVHVIDTRLVDLLYRIRRTVGAREPFHIISGYRAPITNAMLREGDHSVARHSFHMEGKAVDIRLPGCSLNSLHHAAMKMQSGGVGFYQMSNFVHVDVGPVRHW